MKEEWEAKNFEECIDHVSYPSKVPKKSFLNEGQFPVISQEQEYINGYWSDEANLFRLKKPVVIFGDHTKILKYIDFDFVLGADGVKILQPRDFLDPKFFYYFLNAFPVKGLGYARHYRLLKKLDIQFPNSLSEQKHIVTILDEAFERIDRAVANAEKNLANARELFESYLNKIFAEKGDGWVEKKLGDIAYLAGRIGWKGLTAKEYTKEGPLFISVHSLNYGDYVDYRDAFHISQERYDESPEIMLQPNDVLICKDGAGIGKMGIVEYIPSPATINSSLLIIRALKTIQPKYLYRVLCGLTFQSLVQERIDGATTPHLYQREIKELIVPVPPKAKQQEIIERLDKIRKETLCLENIYQRKLTALAELKQSLLQKAFSGELTESPRMANVVSFPKTIQGISTTDLHAGILAIAYQMHEGDPKLEKTFGHVKAEKMAHMVEAYAGLNLDRKPFKDAAGPNDFRHLKQVEHRAKKAGFFAFKGSEKTSYTFKKYKKFDELVNKTRQTLGDEFNTINKILKLMLPMDTKQAEVFATVYAAWNNLLIMNEDISDEAIVYEARENWHEAKLKIPRQKFFKAIQWIRDKGLIPEGKGKLVAEKTSK